MTCQVIERWFQAGRVLEQTRWRSAMSNVAATMPFATLLGLEVTSATPDQVIGTLTIRQEFCTVGNAVHGGTLMAFADSLGAIGAVLTLPDGAMGTTTIESKTNFTGRARVGTELTGVATPVSIGKRLSVWQTRITDPEDRLVAMIMQTQLVL